MQELSWIAFIVNELLSWLWKKYEVVICLFICQVKDTTFAKTMSPGLKLLYVSTCNNKDKSFTPSMPPSISEQEVQKKMMITWLNMWSQTHLVFLCCAHIFFSVESRRVGSGLGMMQYDLKHCLTMKTDFWMLPDCPSEAVFQRRGAYIKDVDLGEPGVDACHLYKERMLRLKTKTKSELHQFNPLCIRFHRIPYRWLLLLHLVVVVFLFPWPLRSQVARERETIIPHINACTHTEVKQNQFSLYDSSSKQPEEKTCHTKYNTYFITDAEQTYFKAIHKCCVTPLLWHSHMPDCCCSFPHLSPTHHTPHLLSLVFPEHVAR